MSVTHSARRTALLAGQSRPLELLTRAGFVGYGVLHLVVAWLAVQIALGKPSVEGDQTGAFRLLERQPIGRVVLILTIVGLFAMALWQLILAAVGHREERGWRRVAERLMSLARAVVYAALAWTGTRVFANAAESSATQQQKATAGILAQPAGRWLVGLAGLVIIGIGVGMAVYGWRRAFEKRLRTGEMTARTRRIGLLLGQVGYLAKGCAFGIVGWLILQAAVTYDAAQARGLDAALRTLAARSYGVLLLFLIAAGFAAFGVYCFFQSRYRKV